MATRILDGVPINPSLISCGAKVFLSFPKRLNCLRGLVILGTGCSLAKGYAAGAGRLF